MGSALDLLFDMETNKKINIEQLLKIAKDNKEKLFISDGTSDLNEAQKFVIAMDIKAGKNKVLAHTIYEAYASWALKPITKIGFFIMFSRMFEGKKGKYKTYYFVNYKPAELMKEVNMLRGRYS